MADVWKSRPKWTCKYCDVTINDDAPSRQQHESGLRHKNNVERALRDVYKRQDREKREKEENDREMKKIERLAREAHQADLARASGSPAQDRIGTDAIASTSKSPPATGSTAAAWKPADKFSAYGSVAAEEAYRLEAEAEAAETAAQEAETARRIAREAAPGEWEAVVVEQQPSTLQPPQQVDSDSDRRRSRGFRIKERSGAFGSDDDEGDLQQIKVKKRIKVQETDEVRRAREEEEKRRTLRPEEWTGLRLAPAKTERGDDSGGGAVAKAEPPGRSEDPDVVHSDERKAGVRPPASVPVSANNGVKGEATGLQVKQEDGSNVDEAPGDPPNAAATTSEAVPAATSPDETQGNGGGGGGASNSSNSASSSANSMFKKRKAGTGAGSKKVRMF